MRGLFWRTHTHRHVHWYKTSDGIISLFFKRIKESWTFSIWCSCCQALFMFTDIRCLCVKATWFTDKQVSQSWRHFPRVFVLCISFVVVTPFHASWCQGNERRDDEFVRSWLLWCFKTYYLWFLAAEAEGWDSRSDKWDREPGFHWGEVRSTTRTPPSVWLAVRLLLT